MPAPVLVAVLGYTGGVGTALMAAIAKICDPAHSSAGKCVLFAAANSKQMWIENADGSSNPPEPADLPALATKLLAAASAAGQVPVIADVTASAAIAGMYTGWLEQGISVVAANKPAFAGPEAVYQGMLAAAKAAPACRLLHEATVGAGLPVISTLNELTGASHRITNIEGVLSGTLAYVLGQVAGGKATLSAAVAGAKALGFTEPDPREDLSGMDVARKAVILARVAGLAGVELEKLEVESLVPAELQGCSVDEFMAGLPAFDAAFADRIAKVEAAGQKLFYAAAVDVPAKTVTVGPLAVGGGHPFAGLSGTPNCVTIGTDLYAPGTVVVTGAGAGADVTATGVLGDILKCGFQ